MRFEDKSALLVIIFFVIIILIISFINFYFPSTLVLSLKESTPTIYQLYYDIGNGYNKVDSVRMPINKINEFTSIEFKLPLKKIKRIKIDFGDKGEPTIIKQIFLRNIVKEYHWDVSNITKDFEFVGNTTRFELQEGALVFYKGDQKAQLEFAKDFGALFHSMNSIRKFYLYVLSLLLFFILLLALRYATQIEKALIGLQRFVVQRFAEMNKMIEEVKLKDGKYFYLITLLISTFVLIIYLWGISHKTIARGDQKFQLTALPESFIITILILIILLLAYHLLRFKAVYFAFLFVGFLYVLFVWDFAPLDEGSHFAYLHYIAKNHKLPLLYSKADYELKALSEEIYTNSSRGLTTEIYEAVQPPLYYLIASIVFLLTPGSLLVKFYTLRFSGLLGGLISIYFLEKAYKELINKGIIKGNSFLFFSTVCLCVLSPAFLIRMATINYIQLLVPLGSIIFYVLIKFSFLERLKFREVFLLSILSGASILTFFISVFLPVVVAIFLLVKRQFKQMIVYALLVFIIILPWFLHNQYHYGYFTAHFVSKGMLQHIMNPNFTTYDIFTILNSVPYMLASFWVPIEAQFNSLIFIIVNFLSFSMIFILLYYVYILLKSPNNSPQSYSKIIIFISTFAIILNTGLMCYVTIAESWPTIVGRYLYLIVNCFIFLIYLFVEKNFERQQRVISLIFLISVVFLCSNFLVEVFMIKG